MLVESRVRQRMLRPQTGCHVQRPNSTPVNAATAIQLHYGGGPSMGRSVAGSESPTGVPYRRSCRRAEAAVGGDGNNGGAKGTRPPDLLVAKVAPSSNRCVCNALILPHRVA